MFCCIVLDIFFVGSVFFDRECHILTRGPFFYNCFFETVFLLISLEITYLNIYTHNNKFFLFVLTLVWGTFKFFVFFMDFFCFRFCSRQFLISMMGNVKFPNHKKILNFTFHSFLKKQSKLSHLGFLNWRLGGRLGEGVVKITSRGQKIFQGNGTRN